MKKLLFFIPLLFVVQLIHAQTWDWGGPLDPLQAKFQIQQYRLELDIFPETQSIAGQSTITFMASEKLDTLRFTWTKSSCRAPEGVYPAELRDDTKN